MEEKDNQPQQIRFQGHTWTHSCCIQFLPVEQLTRRNVMHSIENTSDISQGSSNLQDNYHHHHRHHHKKTNSSELRHIEDQIVMMALLESVQPPSANSEGHTRNQDVIDRNNKRNNIQENNNNNNNSQLNSQRTNLNNISDKENSRDNLTPELQKKRNKEQTRQNNPFAPIEQNAQHKDKREDRNNLSPFIRQLQQQQSTQNRTQQSTNILQQTSTNLRQQQQYPRIFPSSSTGSPFMNYHRHSSTHSNRISSSVHVYYLNNDQQIHIDTQNSRQRHGPNCSCRLAPQQQHLHYQFHQELNEHEQGCSNCQYLILLRQQLNQFHFEQLRMTGQVLSSEYLELNQIFAIYPFLVEANNINRNQPALPGRIQGLKKILIKENQKDKTCSICYENYIKDELKSQLPCLHEFHEECVLLWLNNHNSCPVCRQQI